MAHEWTTLAIVKSDLHLGITDTDYDTSLTQLIQDVTERMIDYLDNDAISHTSPGTQLNFACAKQVAYEWRRRKDAGLSSKTYPDGSISKYEIQEWLPDVRDILDREREYAI